MIIRALAACIVFAATSIASAQTHTDSFTYQGSLMDGGAPANGFYDITFVVYDSAVGGVIVPSGIQFVGNVEVVDGLFEAFVDFGVSGIVFDSDQARWLQLNVNNAGQPGSIVLAPRQRMAPAPLANYALRSGSSLQDAYDNGSTIFRGVGDSAVSIRSTGASAAQLNLGSNAGGESEGSLFIYGPTGGTMFRVEQDINGVGGGFLSLASSNSNPSGLLVDGNAFGTESTQVSIVGTASTIVFSTQSAGNNAVKLPVDAISSSEILNETGFAEYTSNSSVFLSSSPAVIDVVGSVTTDVPTDGYVFVIASAELTISHVTGTTSSVDLGVSASTTSIPSHGDLETRIDSNISTGGYDHAVTVHSVFEVSAGSNTFYLLGDENSGGGLSSVFDTQLTAIFIPTAYGSGVRDAGPSFPDAQSPTSAPMSNYDIVMEQNASLRANAERQQRELDEMKAQVQQLLIQAQRTREQQSQGD